MAVANNEAANTNVIIKDPIFGLETDSLCMTYPAIKDISPKAGSICLARCTTKNDINNIDNEYKLI